MEHIKQTVQSVIKDIKDRKLSTNQKTFELFKKSLASNERKHTRCVALRNGILTVHVDSSVRLYQLNLKKESLLKELGLKNIRFFIGEVK